MGDLEATMQLMDIMMIITMVNTMLHPLLVWDCPQPNSNHLVTNVKVVVMMLT
jgi:hypothetical protein